MIGDDCEISPYTVVEDANLAAACTIGPFARLRPGAELLEGAHVGNFVEMKKARLGKGSKAGHLTYRAMRKLAITLTSAREPLPATTMVRINLRPLSATMCLLVPTLSWWPR